MNRLLLAIDKCSAWPSKLACWLCFLLLLLTCEQVIARYWFQSSSIALQELQWHFFGSIFTLSMAYGLQKDQHVRVDIFYQRWSPRKKALCNLIGHCCFLWPMCAVLIYYGWTEVELSQSYPSNLALDHWTQANIEPSSLIHKTSLSIENFLRHVLLFGEGSSDPGGLEARWIPKALIPLSGFLLALQGLALVIKDLRLCIWGKHYISDPSEDQTHG